MTSPFPRDLESLSGYSDVLSIHIDEVGADRCVVSCTVGAAHLQGLGIVHGGVYCWLVETAASAAAAVWFGERGSVVGVSNRTNFLRPVRGGSLTATATPVQRGRSRQIWQVDVTDDAGTRVALGELHVANLGNRAEPANPDSD